MYSGSRQATQMLKKTKNDEASRAALKELIESGQKIGLLRLTLEKMLKRYPQWSDEIKDEIHQDKKQFRKFSVRKLIFTGVSVYKVPFYKRKLKFVRL